MKSKILGLLAVGLLVGPMDGNAVDVRTTDFIADSSRTNFVGFESLPTYPPDFFNGPLGYTEDGVVVTQVNGQGEDIWSGCESLCFGSNSTGKSWYPNGGDFGWTEITLSNGSQFQDVVLLLGTGFLGASADYVFYELFSGATSVLAGSMAFVGGGSYLGFSGGGFDRIWLRESLSASGTSWGDLNALAIDNIELAGTTVPEPGTLALLGLGLAGLGLSRRRKAA